jgi:hypothetical protein
MSSWIFPAAAVLAQLLCRFPAAVVVFPGRLSRRSISRITTRPDPDSFPNMMKLSLVVMAMMADAAKACMEFQYWRCLAGQIGQFLENINISQP